MGHLSLEHYHDLQSRMDRAAPGIVDSKYLYEILKLLFTDEEAKLCSLMPLTEFSLSKIAGIWGKGEEESENILKELADKGLVYEHQDKEEKKYVLSPPLLGFFEFTLMRTDGKFDRKQLSELYYTYINKKGALIRKYAALEPPLMRILVQEDMVDELSSEILSYEKASRVIDSAECISVGTCYCRHKMEHVGRACDNPQDVCLSLNDVAKYLVKHGIAKEIDKSEAQRILDLCVKKGLVQMADNVREKVAMLCNCCGCCCESLLSYKFPRLNYRINPSDYIIKIDESLCSACGVCVDKCPAGIINQADGRVSANKERCLGCGVCARFCPTSAIKMQKRSGGKFIPQNTNERYYLMAIDRGKLGNYLFEDQKSRRYKILSRTVNRMVKIAWIKKFLLRPTIYRALIKLFSNKKVPF